MIFDDFDSDLPATIGLVQSERKPRTSITDNVQTMRRHLNGDIPMVTAQRRHLSSDISAATSRWRTFGGDFWVSLAKEKRKKKEERRRRQPSHITKIQGIEFAWYTSIFVNGLLGPLTMIHFNF